MTSGDFYIIFDTRVSFPVMQQRWKHCSNEERNILQREKNKFTTNALWDTQLLKSKSDDLIFDLVHCIS